MKSNYVLKKDLPNCPKGRVFRPTYDGTHYFLSMTDNEVMSGRLHDYKFKAGEVENNPDWFKKETESDLKIQLYNAKRQKEDAENKIIELKKKIKK
jgi:hypothetical protein